MAQSGAPSRRRQSQPRAVRQFQSSAPSRGSGSSVSSVALPVAARTEEPRKRRLVVRFPPAATDVYGTATKRSPLSRETRDTIEQNAQDGYATCVALARDELVSRDRHFDEIRSSTLPESLEVYLPGRESWHDVQDDMQDTLRDERQPDVSSGGLVLSPACNQTAIFDTGITLGRRFSPPPSPPFIRRSKD